MGRFIGPIEMRPPERTTIGGYGLQDGEYAERLEVERTRALSDGEPVADATEIEHNRERVGTKGHIPRRGR